MTYLYATPLKAKELKEQFKCDTFVETGCHIGDGLAYAADVMGFTELYSCDIRQEACDQAKSRAPHANVMVADSLTFLKDTVEKIQGKRTMFWLDAHLPEDYGVSAKEAGCQAIPIIDELAYLAAHKEGIEHDVVICDDFMTLMCDKDALFRWQWYSHDVGIVRHDTGYLVFTPKLVFYA